MASIGATVAIGARDHSGWAVLVAAAVGPEVVDRRRVTLIDPDLPRQPYHAAVGSELDDAAALVARVERSAAAEASAVVEALTAELREAGHEVAGLAVAADTTTVPDSLDAILGSHPLLHAAEGALFREALVSAAEGVDLAVTRFRAKTVVEDAAAACGETTAALRARLDELRAALGPPWQKDHKEATAAALLALATAATGAGA